MSVEPIIQYWYHSGEEDLKVAQGLFKLKHYSHCLFFCHLALEKMLKAIFAARHRIHAPYIHDLVVLAEKSGLELTKQQQNYFEIITSFNIQGRYADYKFKFYRTFNKRSVARKYLLITQQLIIWLENELTQK